MAANVATVKWFHKEKGYGFLQPDDGAKDVFVHITAVQRSGLDNLYEGQRVSYQLVAGKQGKINAEQIKLLD